MNVTCRSILSLPYANRLKPLAGRDGMDNVITWFHYLEDPNYVDWLKGGELVLITGLVTKESENMLLSLIDTLYEKGVSGIIINLSFYIKAVPQTVIDRGDFLGLPIFEMPAQMRIVDISQSICYAIFKEETRRYDVSITLFGILSGSRLTSKRLNRLVSAGYHPEGKYRAVVMKPAGLTDEKPMEGQLYNEETLEREFKHLEQTIQSYLKAEECLGTTDEDSYIWMLPVSDGEQIQELIQHFGTYLKESCPHTSFRIGVGNVFSDLRNLKTSVESAQEAIRIGMTEPSENEIYFYDDMIVLRLFEKFEDKEELKEIAAQVLKDLLLEENAELLQTVIQFVKCNFQAKAAAEKLFIHENTMHYRLKKIAEMLKLDYKNQRDMLHLTLAVEIINLNIL